MKFLADMGISQKTVRWLTVRGHDTVHLRDRGWQRYRDDRILEEARSESRVVLTMDLDFGYLMAVSRSKLPSVIIFRLEDERPANMNLRLKSVLENSSDALMAGAIISVSEHDHRIRLLPIVG